MARWVHSRRPLEHSTPATSSPLLSVRSFSEVNEDASKLITHLARLTAKTDFGKSMSPLVSHSRKGGAFPIMQSQFRRALGCMIARGQAQHLLKRRHYARPSAREAYQTAEDNHSKHRSRPKASMSGYARRWQNFIPEGYDLYQQWRNGKNFGSIYVPKSLSCPYTQLCYRRLRSLNLPREGTRRRYFGLG